MTYRADEGRYARLAAFWALAALTFYGCYAFNTQVLQTYFKTLNEPLVASMPKVPILGFRLSAATLITTVLVALALWSLNRWLNRPKSADLLIETESELRKVTWPTFPEAVNSSIVVIACVAFLMAFLAGADWVLGKWAKVILTGQG